MASMAGVRSTFPIQLPPAWSGSHVTLTASRSHITLTASRSHITMSMAAPGREADGSEFSTDGNRLVRARNGNGAGCRFYPAPCFAGPGAVSRFLYRPHYRRTKSESQALLPISSTPGGCLNYLRLELFVGAGRLIRQMEGYGP